ncbi:hypothetical protein [Saccharopolyspora phatthalungensis]|uniref:Uncharacterized protein n=1 Tax=Saccharopolyspora phatthalungensis TaxID=664693 RepID=A0A840Q8M5_9PSEU|nr:hypothetical protein [Saccharopolyspora phatthalungensis]MBB5157094.1 hypothetical protein [Saccharopolyspora phatthalungensis]
MLTVVQDDQDVLVDQKVSQHRPGVAARLVAYVQRGSHGFFDQPGAPEFGELNQPHTVGEGPVKAVCDMEGQPRLTHTAGAGQGDQPGVGERALHLKRGAPPTHKTRPTDRQTPGVRGDSDLGTHHIPAYNVQRGACAVCGAPAGQGRGDHDAFRNHGPDLGLGPASI